MYGYSSSMYRKKGTDFKANNKSRNNVISADISARLDPLHHSNATVEGVTDDRAAGDKSTDGVLTDKRSIDAVTEGLADEGLTGKRTMDEDSSTSKIDSIHNSIV